MRITMKSILALAQDDCHQLLDEHVMNELAPSWSLVGMWYTFGPSGCGSFVIGIEKVPRYCSIG